MAILTPFGPLLTISAAMLSGPPNCAETACRRSPCSGARHQATQFVKDRARFLRGDRRVQIKSKPFSASAERIMIENNRLTLQGKVSVNMQFGKNGPIELRAEQVTIDLRTRGVTVSGTLPMGFR